MPLKRRDNIFAAPIYSYGMACGLLAYFDTPDHLPLKFSVLMDKIEEREAESAFAKSRPPSLPGGP